MPPSNSATINRLTVDEDEIAKFSAMADDWWNETGKFRPLHQLNPVRLAYIRDTAIAHFGLAADAVKPLDSLSLLDIGCGGGLISEPLRRLGAVVTGIDASGRNIGVANYHAEQSGLTIDYRNSTAEETAASGEKYDIVLALEIIEHVADVDMFLLTLHNLVKPGGLLFISTLNRTLKSLLMAKIGAEYILRWLPVGTHDWRKFLEPAEIILPLINYGFIHLDTSGIIFRPTKQPWALSKTDTDVNYILTFSKPA